MKPRLSMGSLPVGRGPLVVGVISTEKTLEHIHELAEYPFDVAEFRIDLIGADSPQWLTHADRLVRQGVPVILTARHRMEGGHWYRDEDERQTLYLDALPYVSAVDVEIQSSLLGRIVEEVSRCGRLIIASFHDFKATPPDEDLRDVVRIAKNAGAHIIKIATFLNSEEDGLRLCGLLAEFPDVHLCILGMGPLGSESRITFPLAGSCLTYGFVDQVSAPGQLSSAKLQERLINESPGYMEFALRRKASRD